MTLSHATFLLAIITAISAFFIAKHNGRKRSLCCLSVCLINSSFLFTRDLFCITRSLLCSANCLVAEAARPVKIEDNAMKNADIAVIIANKKVACERVIYVKSCVHQNRLGQEK